VASDISQLPDILEKLNSNLRTYKSLEADGISRRDALLIKVPQIQKALAMLDLLEKQETGESLDTHFEISDTVFANASVDKPEHVCLWIGVGAPLVVVLVRWMVCVCMFVFVSSALCCYLCFLSLSLSLSLGMDLLLSHVPPSPSLLCCCCSAFRPTLSSFCFFFLRRLV
jgi:Prefoldin subunit